MSRGKGLFLKPKNPVYAVALQDPHTSLEIEIIIDGKFAHSYVSRLQCQTSSNRAESC